MDPVLQYVDAVTVPVPDPDRGLAFYRDVLGHQLIWRSEAAGQAGLRTPGSGTEIVLTTRQSYEPDSPGAARLDQGHLRVRRGHRRLVTLRGDPRPDADDTVSSVDL